MPGKMLSRFIISLQTYQILMNSSQHRNHTEHQGFNLGSSPHLGYGANNPGWVEAALSCQRLETAESKFRRWTIIEKRRVFDCFLFF
jgi:hypothetical protein